MDIYLTVLLVEVSQKYIQFHQRGNMSWVWSQSSTDIIHKIDENLNKFHENFQNLRFLRNAMMLVLDYQIQRNNQSSGYFQIQSTSLHPLIEKNLRSQTMPLVSGKERSLSQETNTSARQIIFMSTCSVTCATSVSVLVISRDIEKLPKKTFQG